MSVQSKQDATCASANSGSATFSATGGTGAYTYTWQPNVSTTATASNITAGTYNVTATDANGCTGIGSVTINAAPAPTLTLGTPTNPSCGQANGSVSATLAGGTAPYQVTIDNGQGSPQTQTIPMAGTAPVSNLAAGTYTITVRDANNCTTSQTLTLTAPNSPTINPVNVTAETCAGQNNGSIVSATATGGTGTLQWSYAPAATPNSTTNISSFPVNNLAAGSYIIFVRDANSCTASQTFTIAAGANCCNLSLAVSTTQPSCGQADGGITVTPSPAGTYTYTWSNSLPNQATQSNLAAGQYRVTVNETANPSCTKDTVINLNPSNGPTLSFSNQVNPGCGQTNGSVSITLAGGTAPYQVTIDDGQGSPQTQTVPIAGTAPVGNLAAGSYTITVNDANSCSVVQTLTLTAPNPPVITSINATAETCAGDNNGTANVIVNGGNGALTYTWSNSGSAASINNLSPGVYKITVTDAANCSATDSVTVSAGPVCCTVNISAAITQPSCGNNDGGINLTILPAATYTYTWSNGNSTANNSGLGAGTYSVTVTNTGNNCTKDTTFSLSNPNAPTVSNVTSTPESCTGNDGTASLTASGGTGTLTITWSNGNSGNNIAQLAAGNYSYTVTDQNSCQATGTVTVAPAVGCCFMQAAASTVATSCGENNGSISVSITTNGTAPYQYSTNGSSYQQADSFTNLSGGDYTVYVLDANSCADTLTLVNVGVSSNTLAINFNTIDPGCAGANSGSIDAQVTGGTPAYTYTWSNGASDSSLSNLAAGTYSLTITDNNSCSFSSSATLNATQPFSIALGNDTAFCAGGNALLNAPSGYAAYAWSSGDTTQQINVAQSGTYSVTVSNSGGCTAAASVHVTVTPLPIIDLPTDTTMFENNPIMLVPIITGNATGEYLWTPDEAISCLNCAQPVVNPTDTTIYVLRFTDASKCPATATIKVNVVKGGDIYMPNVFSPNGDGNNDIFKPLGFNVKHILWKVFNRWGELVFQSDDFNIGWDGMFKSSPQPAGVYVYTMDVTFQNKVVKHYKGSISLI
ncbi:MAG TPA: gliding motility-associated C-terminal domain-containing protein, partial [Chitinophagales bacterium]|nr:gliding motility-associated C-terminal domain-containing protein [Chitinophagales bacterium]